MFSKEESESDEQKVNKEPQEENKVEEQDEDQMSDYIDENFEMDETDEHWCKEQLELKHVLPKQNDIEHVNAKCLHLKDDVEIKARGNYKYVLPFDQE